MPITKEQAYQSLSEKLGDSFTGKVPKEYFYDNFEKDEAYRTEALQDIGYQEEETSDVKKKDEPELGGEYTSGDFSLDYPSAKAGGSSELPTPDEELDLINFDSEQYASHEQGLAKAQQDKLDLQEKESKYGFTHEDLSSLYTAADNRIKEHEEYLKEHQSQKEWAGYQEKFREAGSMDEFKRLHENKLARQAADTEAIGDVLGNLSTSISDTWDEWFSLGENFTKSSTPKNNAERLEFAAEHERRFITNTINMFEDELQVKSEKLTEDRNAFDSFVTDLDKQILSGNLSPEQAQLKYDTTLSELISRGEAVKKESQLYGEIALSMNNMFLDSYTDRQHDIESGVRGFYQQGVELPRNLASLYVGVAPLIGEVVSFRSPVKGVISAEKATEDAFKVYERADKLAQDLGTYIDPENPTSEAIGRGIFQIANMYLSFSGTTMLTGLSSLGKVAIGAQTLSMNKDELFNEMINNGNFSLEEANTISSIYAVPAAGLDILGQKSGLTRVARRQMHKSLINTMLKDKAAGLTKEGAKRNIQKVAKEFGIDLLKEGGEEGITEAAQNVLMEYVKIISNEIDEQDKFIVDWGSDYQSKDGVGRFKLQSKEELESSTVESGMIGAFLGGGATTVTKGVSGAELSSKGIMDKLTSPSYYTTLQETAKLEHNKGTYSKEEYDTILTNMGNARQAVVTTEGIKNKSDRVKAIDLTLEKAGIQSSDKIVDKARVKEINTELSEVGTDNANALSPKTLGLLDALASKNEGIRKVVDMIQSSEAIKVTETTEGDKTVDTSEFETAKKKAIKELDSTIDALENSNEENKVDMANEVRNIRDDIVNNDGNNLYSPSTINESGLEGVDNNRFKNIQEADKVIAGKDDSYVLDNKDAANIHVRLKKRGVNPNTIVPVRNLKGMTAGNVRQLLAQAQSTLGKLSPESRAYVDVQNISRATGVETKVIDNAREKAKSKGYDEKTSTAIAGLYAKTVNAIAAREGKSANVVAKNLDIFESVEDITNSKGKIAPLVALANAYASTLTGSEKTKIAKWAKEDEWNDKVAKKFINGFVRYISLGKTNVQSLEESFGSLRDFIKDAFGGIRGSDIDVKVPNAIKNIMAKATGDFNRGAIEERANKIKKLEEANKKQGAIRRDLAKRLANLRSQTLEDTLDTTEEVKAVRDDNWADEFKANLPESSIKSKAEFKDLILNGKWGMLTGENPAAKASSESANKTFNRKAEQWLKRNKYVDYTPIYGKYDNHEASFIVPNMSDKDAARFARDLKQESVATDSGLIYGNETMNPRVKGEEDFSSKSNEDNYFSSINIDGDIVDFAVGYDLETVVPTKENKEQRVSRKSVILNDPQARAKILAEVSIEESNLESALELANVNLVTIAYGFSGGMSAVNKIVKILENYHATSDPTNLRSHDAKIDKYIAYDRVVKAAFSEMDRYKTADLFGAARKFTRLFTWAFGDTKEVMRAELMNRSIEDQEAILMSSGLMDFLKASAKSATDVEVANDFRLEINKKMKEYDLLNNEDTTEQAMSRTTWLAWLLSPSTKNVGKLDTWFDTVIDNIEIHSENIQSRKDNFVVKTMKRENDNSINGAEEIQSFLKKIKGEMYRQGKTMQDNWSEVITRIKDKYPMEYDILNSTASMHKIHADIVLNAKKKMGDEDTHQGTHYNSVAVRRAKKSKDLDMDSIQDKGLYNKMTDSTGSMEDRGTGRLGEGQYIVTWDFVGQQQRAYNNSSKIAYTGEYIRQMDYATNTREFADLVGSDKGVKAIRDKIAFMVNINGAKDEVRLMEGSKNSLKKVYHWIMNLKNQNLMTTKQPFVQSSVAFSTAVVASRQLGMVVADLGNVDNLASMLTVMTKGGSLGGRNATYFIDNAMSSSVESTGFLVGNSPKVISEFLLASPDYAAATTSWLSFYVRKKFQMSGKGWMEFKKEFSWEEEAKNINKKAANTADVMQQGYQASNIKEAGSRFSTSTLEAVSMVRETLYPFKYFDNSYRSNLLIDGQMALRGDAEAIRRMGGYLMIPSVYSLVKQSFKGALWFTVLSQLGWLDTEEDEDDSEEDKIKKVDLKRIKATMESTATENMNKAWSWEGYGEALAEELAFTFFMPFSPDVEVSKQIANVAFGAQYMMGSGDVDLVSVGKRYTGSIPHTKMHKSFGEFLESDSPFLDIYTGDRDYWYLAPVAKAAMRAIDFQIMASTGVFENNKGELIPLTESERSQAAFYGAMGAITIFSPLQEPRRATDAIMKDYEEIIDGYRFDKLAREGLLFEENDEGTMVHADLHDMMLVDKERKEFRQNVLEDWTKLVIKNNDSRDYTSPTEALLVERNKELAELIIKANRGDKLTAQEQRMYIELRMLQNDALQYLEAREDYEESKGD